MNMVTLKKLDDKHYLLITEKGEITLTKQQFVDLYEQFKSLVYEA